MLNFDKFYQDIVTILKDIKYNIIFNEQDIKTAVKETIINPEMEDALEFSTKLKLLYIIRLFDNPHINFQEFINDFAKLYYCEYESVEESLHRFASKIANNITYTKEIVDNIDVAINTISTWSNTIQCDTMYEVCSILIKNEELLLNRIKKTETSNDSKKVMNVINWFLRYYIKDAKLSSEIVQFIKNPSFKFKNLTVNTYDIRFKGFRTIQGDNKTCNKLIITAIEMAKLRLSLTSIEDYYDF